MLESFHFAKLIIGISIHWYENTFVWEVFSQIDILKLILISFNFFYIYNMCQIFALHNAGSITQYLISSYRGLKFIQHITTGNQSNKVNLLLCNKTYYNRFLESQS